MATSPAPGAGGGGTLKRDKGWMGTLTRRSRKAEKEGTLILGHGTSGMEKLPVEKVLFVKEGVSCSGLKMA